MTLHLDQWYEGLACRTGLRLHDEKMFVHDYITDEEMVEAYDIRELYRDRILRLCRWWAESFGQKVLAIEPAEGQEWTFEVVMDDSPPKDYIDGEVVSVHEVREITDGR